MENAAFLVVFLKSLRKRKKNGNCLCSNALDHRLIRSIFLCFCCCCFVSPLRYTSILRFFSSSVIISLFVRINKIKSRRRKLLCQRLKKIIWLKPQAPHLILWGCLCLEAQQLVYLSYFYLFLEVPIHSLNFNWLNKIVTTR